MFFFKSKALSHKQTAMIGFTLAVLSVLTTSICVFIFPQLGKLLDQAGVYTLDYFLLGIFVTIFFAVQGLLLFGFPLYYVQDKKSHMTGFQIMVFELLWIIVLTTFIGLMMVPFAHEQSYNLEDLVPTMEEPVSQ